MNMQIDKRETAKNNRQHLNRVMASSAARHASRHILGAMVRAADVYSDPVTVTITKTQIIVDTCLSLNTVKIALANLRAEGVIFPMAGLAGGRFRAVTYGFRVVGQGTDTRTETVGQGADYGAIWAQALTDLRKDNRDRSVAWYVPLSLTGITGTEAQLTAPTAFIANQVQTRAELSEPLCAALGVNRLRITQG